MTLMDDMEGVTVVEEILERHKILPGLPIILDGVLQRCSDLVSSQGKICTVISGAGDLNESIRILSPQLSEDIVSASSFSWLVWIYDLGRKLDFVDNSNLNSVESDRHSTISFRSVRSIDDLVIGHVGTAFCPVAGSYSSRVKLPGCKTRRSSYDLLSSLAVDHVSDSRMHAS